MKTSSPTYSVHCPHVSQGSESPIGGLPRLVSERHLCANEPGATDSCRAERAGCAIGRLLRLALHTEPAFGFEVGID